jgi:arylformamidase
MPYYDVTVPVRPGMPVYEGDPAVSLERVASMAAGAICNVSRLDFGVHTGTHIDAPLHFIEGAPGIEATPLDALMGPCAVVDATEIDGDIDEIALGLLIIPDGCERVLFKTRNSALWDLPEYSPQFVGLTAGAADALVDRGVRLAGIDYLSIAPAADPAPTHVVLLGHGVVVLEGLDLRNVAAGAYELLCLPLLLPGADGAPARVILRH